MNIEGHILTVVFSLFAAVCPNLAAASEPDSISASNVRACGAYLEGTKFQLRRTNSDRWNLIGQADSGKENMLANLGPANLEDIDSELIGVKGIASDKVEHLILIREQSITSFIKDGSNYRLEFEWTLSNLLFWERKPKEKIEHFQFSENGRFILFWFATDSAIKTKIVYFESRDLLNREQTTRTTDHLIFRGTPDQVGKVSVSNDGRIHVVRNQ